MTNLRIAARTSSFALKGKNVDIREIAEKLNVRAVLEGSVRKVGSRIRVTAQPIRADDGYHQWSERYGRNLDDIFAIQDDISSSIVDALEIEIHDSERRCMERTATKSVEAYQFYLRGRHLFDEGRSKSFPKAIDLFTRATQIDPAYGLAYAGIAECYAWLYEFHGREEATVLKCLDASRKAVECAPAAAEAQTARGHAFFLREQFEEAHKHFEKAIQLNPNSFEAFYAYARAWRWRSYDSGEAEKYLRRAAELFQRAAEIRPEDSHSLLFLGTVYLRLGDPEHAAILHRESVERGKRSLAIRPDDARTRLLCALGLSYLGEMDEAFALSEQAIASDPTDAHLLYNVACLHGICGKTDQCLSRLAQAIDAGFRYRYLIERDSDFNSVRADPRFQSLLERLE